jgi:hypothetical protein
MSSMVHLMRSSMAALCAIGVAAIAVIGDAAAPARPTPQASRIETYKRDGTTYFALSLQPAADAVPAAAAHDIVVLFDTSASQTGAYREKALEVFENFLAGLGEEDRVHLISVDITAAPMTKSFVPPRSAEMQAALANLSKRVPLGSTDMAGALLAAAESFVVDGAAARTAIYIGDGMNNAGAMGDERRRRART